MITRLEGEEESSNSDEWQLQRGPFTGTGEPAPRRLKEPRGAGDLRQGREAQRLWALGFTGLPPSSAVALGSFFHLFEPLLLICHLWV